MTRQRKRKEIIKELNTLVDRVWVNRFYTREAKIEDGTVTIIPDNEERLGDNVIHVSVYNRAVDKVNEIQDRLGLEGPYTDFEWGMINGKLSALRWILGDEWDMLHT